MTGNTLEQRAHKLLAAEYGCDESELTAPEIRAATAALSLSAGADWQPIETAPKDGTWILLRGHNAAGQPMIPVVAAFRPAGSTHLGWVDSGSFRVMDSMADEWMPRPDAAPRHEPDDALRGDKA